MRNGVQTVAMWFGALAGIAGVEHGYFEILQGNSRPDGLGFASIGPPCVPETVWHACEPAMSIVPNLLMTGIASLLLGIGTLVWVFFAIQHRFGGVVLVLLSIMLLLLGGGIVPPVIGFIGGITAVASEMRRTEGKRPLASMRYGMAFMWPWTLIGFFALLFGTVAIGYFFDDFVIQNGIVILIGLPTLLVLSVTSAWAKDAS